MSKLCAWFDIPVADMDRAVQFYEKVTGRTLMRAQLPEGKETANFGMDGCLFKASEDEPSHKGSRVYFSAEPSIEDWITRIEASGGRILVPKTPIGEGKGHFAYFEDSEGNRVGLHSPG